jgi:hypothetical protein
MVGGELVRAAATAASEIASTAVAARMARRFTGLLLSF